VENKLFSSKMRQYLENGKRCILLSYRICRCV